MIKKSLIVCAVLLVQGVYAQQPVPPSITAIIEKNASLGLSGYPFSFWNYANLKDHGTHFTEAEVESWREAGFTAPMLPRHNHMNPKDLVQIKQLLDWCKARDMKAVIPDGRTWAPVTPADWNKKRYVVEFKQALADYGSHPATLGFQVFDEPLAPVKDINFEIVRLQKELAPHLHPFLNLLPNQGGTPAAAGATAGWPAYLDEYAKKGNPDFYSYDCYEQGNPGDAGFNDYFRNLREFREAMLRNGIPFWTTLIGIGHYTKPPPTLDDFRWQVNTAVASGAAGIAWFHYYQREPEGNYRLGAVDEFWEKTQTYYDIRRVQRNLLKRYKNLFSKLVCVRASFTIKTYGDGKLFTPNGVIAAVGGGASLIGEFVDAQGRRYVMGVNNSKTQIAEVPIIFKGADAKVFSYDWNGNEYEGKAYSALESHPDTQGLFINHILAPGQEFVYRVESKSAAAEPLPLP